MRIKVLGSKQEWSLVSVACQGVIREYFIQDLDLVAVFCREIKGRLNHGSYKCTAVEISVSPDGHCYCSSKEVTPLSKSGFAAVFEEIAGMAAKKKQGSLQARPRRDKGSLVVVAT